MLSVMSIKVEFNFSALSDLVIFLYEICDVNFVSCKFQLVSIEKMQKEKSGCFSYRLWQYTCCCMWLYILDIHSYQFIFNMQLIRLYDKQ